MCVLSCLRNLITRSFCRFFKPSFLSQHEAEHHAEHHAVPPLTWNPWPARSGGCRCRRPQSTAQHGRPAGHMDPPRGPATWTRHARPGGGYGDVKGSVSLVALVPLVPLVWKGPKTLHQLGWSQVTPRIPCVLPLLTK